MNILAIESSCDETAVAIVRDGREILCDCIASQVELHKLYGGVVPEIASRKHIEAIGIVFDIIGVAVTACPEAPFHAMASRKVAEAPDALRLLRNANRVSSFCNDVIGDICGVISGSASAVIAARAVLGMESTKATIVTLGMSALVAAVTVGGKAVGKTFAMGGSVQVVRSTAKVLCFFRTIFQNKRRK